MKIYKLQQINRLIRSSFLRNTVIWLAHVTRQRYLMVYFDPVLGCNLRCLSCYFSNEEKRKQLKGIIDKADIIKLAHAIFGNTYKLQIGCGAEPTLYKYNPEIIRLGREYGVKYIAMTTNANLLTEDDIIELLEAGLDEITISIHGVTAHTYENLMRNASFDKLISALKALTKVKADFPSFKLRLNYTINHLNIDELSDFFDVYGYFSTDILQLRALRDIGGEIKEVKTDELFYQKLNTVILKLENECKSRNITFIKPDDFERANEINDQKVEENPAYCYVSPKSFWKEDFDWRKETYRTYTKRTKYGLSLFKSIFKPHQSHE